MSIEMYGFHLRRARLFHGQMKWHLKSVLKAMMRYILFLSIFFSSAAHSLDLQGFSPSQKKQISEVLKKIEAIKPQKLKIPPALYRKHSRFFKLFHFHLNGENLLAWINERVRVLRYENTWTVAVNNGGKEVLVGDLFFQSSLLEQIYIIVHEARHSDGNGYPHVICPSGFPYVSPSQPDMDLQSTAGCDNRTDGAYAFQAALLFEFYAYGIIDQTAAGNLYNASTTRINPH